MKKFLSFLSIMSVTTGFSSPLISCSYNKHDIIDKNIIDWNVYDIFQNQTAMDKIAKNTNNYNINDETFFVDSKGDSRTVDDMYKNNWPGGDNPTLNDKDLQFAQIKNIGENFIYYYEKNSSNYSESFLYNKNRSESLKIIDENFDIILHDQSSSTYLLYSSTSYSSSLIYGDNYNKITSDDIHNKTGPMMYMQILNPSYGSVSSYVAFYFYIEINIKQYNNQTTSIDNVDVPLSKDGFYLYNPNNKKWSNSINDKPTSVSIGYQIEIPVF